MERCFERTNTFHLPTDVITFILEDIHKILQVFIKGHPIYFKEGMMDAQCKANAKWITRLEEYHEGKKGAFLHHALKGKMKTSKRV